jgi:N-acyl-D-amino-acid deacylase
MPAQRFGLAKRGLISQGYYADLVLFDPDQIIDTATFSDPVSPSKGIARIWVNGVLSYTDHGATGRRNGRFLARGKTTWIQ